jgi:alpha-mannosidase
VRDLTADREVLAAGSVGNLLQLHPDLPNHWDAWDVDRHYRRTARDVLEADEVSVAESGPAVASVRVVRSFGASRLEQTVRVRAGSRRIDVRTEVDWREREKFLKAAFPIDVHADRATSEIQFGHVHRPTHENTSWDAARFEVCAHRWVHVGEPGYGVALITDSTYGHDVRRSTRADGGTTTSVRLSLLRAPRSPDPDADQGRHTFTYALLPGASIADAVREGYALNLPLREVPGGAGPVPAPLVTSTGSPGAVVEAVKLADDRSGDVVVRLYESLGGRATARLSLAVPIREAVVTDLLERLVPEGSPIPTQVLTVDDEGSVGLSLRPFQVVTIRLRRR